MLIEIIKTFKCWSFSTPCIPVLHALTDFNEQKWTTGHTGYERMHCKSVNNNNRTV